ncbi:MAG: c-type cytochrome [Lewinellaceae bacterium]|nr:c-type cytochrome [Lewinellaceae bacterium]
MSINKYLKFKAIVLFCFVLISFSARAEVSSDQGKKLFTNNCAACHAKDMRSAATGPALGGAQAKWDNQDDLHAWIRNSQALIQSGNPRAVELWNKYKPVVMTSFGSLSDDDIASILLYIDDVYTGKAGPKKADAVAAAPEKPKSKLPLYLIVAAILGILSLLMARIIGMLNEVVTSREGKPERARTFKEIFTSKGVMTFLTFAIIIMGGYFTVNKAVNLGRQEGYKPEQPIKFSHATHAGVNKIDCKYCHDSARRSKVSGIPSANTCMNCHAAIKVGSTYGTAEITKIYASVGYDPNTGTYIQDVQNKSEDDLKAIYTKWIGDKYKESKELASLDAEGEHQVALQWQNIKKSLTNDLKTSIYGPINWVRIHNLPDHVYFNHSQHVSVGKLACQTCHGAIETMDVVQQMSPLSMGWCINCHRQTEVKFKDNAYYANYKQLHDELASGKKSKVTVSDIGGLECQKCHY